eukprot:s625_g36.t1
MCVLCGTKCSNKLLSPRYCLMPWTFAAISRMLSASVASASSPFHIWFAQDQRRYAQKWSSFLGVYDRYLSSFRNTSCALLELGVQSGGSQLMWLDYLGLRSHVYGVDIEPKVAEISNRRITNFIGDIGDPAFLSFLCESIQRIDIIVDDASHLNWHQKLAFEALYPCLNPNGGIYIVEDIGTSYKSTYGGGWRSEDSFIEFAKAKIDELEAFWSCSESVISSRRGRCGSGTLQVPISALTRSTSSIHFHDGLVVFEKRYKEPAVSMETGRLRLPKRFVGFSLYPSHLADSWLPHMFGMGSHGALAGTCSIPQPFQSLDIYDASVRGLVMETLMDHLKSLSLRQEGGELKRKCSDLMSVFQDGLYFSQLGMDFTVVHLKRRSFAVEWNASNRTPLARFAATYRDVKELISWYFGRGAETEIVIVDSLYRNRPRPTTLQAAPIKAALELQRDGFLRLSALGLDMAQLQLEVAQAFQAAQEVEARMLRMSMPWGALDRLFSSDAILELASFYLGADVKVSGYYLLRLKPGLTPAEYSSSTWHHDNCGSRLKLFILLQDVGEDGFYTEIARGSNSMAYYWYDLDHMSRFDDASVKSFFSVERLFSPAGGGFLFDTNALHRVRVDGQKQRDAVVVEISNVQKLREIPMTSCGSQGLDVGRGFPFPHRFSQRRTGF